MKDNKPANYNVDAESRRNLFKVASAIAAGFGGLTIATEAFADGLPASVSPGLTLSLTGLKHHLLDRLEGNETTSVHLQIPAAFTATDITKILQNCDRLKSIIGSRPQSIVNLLQLVQDGKLRAASTLAQQVGLIGNVDDPAGGGEAAFIIIIIIIIILVLIPLTAN